MNNSSLRTVFEFSYQSFLRTQRIIIDRWKDLYKRDFMELPASSSGESSDAAALGSFDEKASNTAGLEQECFENLDRIVRVYDNEENF